MTKRVGVALHRGRGLAAASPFFKTPVTYYSAQKSLMASCNADTLGNPRAAAAASMPPYCWASAETLCPGQFAVPCVPANPPTTSSPMANPPHPPEQATCSDVTSPIQPKNLAPANPLTAWLRV